MSKKVLFIIIFFVVFVIGKILSGHIMLNNDEEIQNSEYIPLSQSLDNFHSSTYETYKIDNTIFDFLSRWDIKGASVAVSKDGRLVFAKGFGYADYENNEMVKPKHLFRIASVSKLITAVTIMKLQEEGKLNLQDKVFGSNGVLADIDYSDIKDSRVYDITIEQLLYHTAGWNGERADPVFTPLLVAKKLDVPAPVDENNTIQYMLMERSLDWMPGRKYSYSNFGYVVLGKVIEEVTQMEYEKFVKFAILHPLGIYDMKIGNSFFEDKDINEVKYYEGRNGMKSYAYDGSGKLVSRQYGANNFNVLAAAGGWIASSAELMKLIVAIDGHTDRQDILKKESIDQMITPDKFGNSVIGWRGSDGNGTWWRTGTLSGSSALVMRQTNNINWVVMFNSSTKRRSHIHNEISKTMFGVINNINDWPQYDLFQYKLAKDQPDNIMAISNTTTN